MNMLKSQSHYDDISVFSACATLIVIESGLQVHPITKEPCMAKKLCCWNVLLGMYDKYGSIQFDHFVSNNYVSEMQSCGRLWCLCFSILYVSHSS